MFGPKAQLLFLVILYNTSHFWIDTFLIFYSEHISFFFIVFLIIRAAMIEPGVRYMPVPLQLPPEPQVTLEAGVLDLTKKSDSWSVKTEQHDTEAERTEDDGSDSDGPIDMSVTATTSLSPVFPGFQRLDRELSPARSDRSDTGLLMRPFLYSPHSPMNRDRSADRSDLDKGTAATFIVVYP